MISYDADDQITEFKDSFRLELKDGEKMCFGAS